MLPMEELASLPLLWGRERIRESKRDEVSGSHTICAMMLNVSLVLSCQETAGSATCIRTWICRLVSLGDCQLCGCFCAGLFWGAYCGYFVSAWCTEHIRQSDVVIRESESVRSESKSCVRMVRAYAGLAEGEDLLCNRKYSVTLARIVQDFVLWESQSVWTERAKSLASDAMHWCWLVSHWFSKTMLDMEGVISCEVDLKESIVFQLLTLFKRRSLMLCLALLVSGMGCWACLWSLCQGSKLGKLLDLLLWLILHNLDQVEDLD
jgi:hypothetical protein